MRQCSAYSTVLVFFFLSQQDKGGFSKLKISNRSSFKESSDFLLCSSELRIGMTFIVAYLKVQWDREKHHATDLR